MSRQPTNRELVWPSPSELLKFVCKVFILILLCVCVTLGIVRYEESRAQAESELARKPTHDSLQISYTNDPDVQVTWYVFKDPDTDREYLFNNVGGVTERLPRTIVELD